MATEEVKCENCSKATIDLNTMTYTCSLGHPLVPCDDFSHINTLREGLK